MRLIWTAGLLSVGLCIGVATAANASILYANNAGGGGIQEYDPATGLLIGTIHPSNVSNGRGVVTVGNILYYTEANSGSVFAYNLQTQASLGAAFTVNGASGLATMAYDGTNLYLGDYSGTNNVYKYSLTGALLQTISLSTCVGFCDGLEFANGFLFSNEADGGFGNPSSYDKYSLTGQLLQKGFITTTFGATGIAFDGTDYYVSNVFSGNIYVYDSNGNFLRIITLQGPTNLIEDLSFDYTQVLQVPEPASMALLGTGLVGLGLMRRRRRAPTA